MRNQIVTSVLLATAAVAVFFTPASAQPQIIQTHCDTLSLDPVEVRMHFAVVNSEPQFVCKVRFIPYWDAENESEVCPISTCAGPEKWICVGPPSRGIWEAVQEQFDPFGACAEQGETVDGFSVVMQGATCWYHVAFFEALALEPFYWDLYYFDCGGAVQALSATWGELKAIYR